MWIYKIINLKNNKIYIGQTIRPVKDRFRRHISDAMNNILDTHLARAIRKYGKDSFIYEIIDTATTQEELTSKEILWIRQLNSIVEGYNETDAIFKCGGNTYKSKSDEELDIIKSKLRKTKLFGLNPNSRKIVATNIKTGEIFYFSSMSECVDHFNLPNHTLISRRCRGLINKPYKNLYTFKYSSE